MHLRLIWESPLGSVHTLSSHLNPFNPLLFVLLELKKAFYLSSPSAKPHP